MPNDIKLDAITRARAAYAMAKTTLEAKLRERLKEELSNLQTQVDIAIRYAYDSGESKASILRAMGTRDWKTLQACLDRTDAVTQIVGQDPLDKAYTIIDDTLVATYNNHGPLDITGMGTFAIKKMGDGTTWFMAVDPLWNADYSVRNDVVAALDGKQDGYYYEEAMGWLNGREL
jgi:hypothetical protein